MARSFLPVRTHKIFEAAVAQVLNAIYEHNFLGLSYGFRPDQGQHDALDGLSVGSPKPQNTVVCIPHGNHPTLGCTPTPLPAPKFHHVMQVDTTTHDLRSRCFAITSLVGTFTLYQLLAWLTHYAIHKPTYFRMGFWFTLAFPVSSSTAVALRCRPLACMAHRPADGLLTQYHSTPPQTTGPAPARRLWRAQRVGKLVLFETYRRRAQSFFSSPSTFALPHAPDRVNIDDLPIGPPVFGYALHKPLIKCNLGNGLCK